MTSCQYIFLVYRTCTDVYKHMNTLCTPPDGVYYITPLSNDKPLPVYCDMTSGDDDSKWLLIINSNAR